MCGVVGILNLDGREVNPSDVELMNGQIVHRGPDSDGKKFFGSFGMGMRRLSIIDLGTGQQPLANEDESIWLVCNGEIYNYRELSDRLKQAGHRFRTGSDCETIVHAYEEYGDDFLK